MVGRIDHEDRICLQAHPRKQPLEEPGGPPVGGRPPPVKEIFPVRSQTRTRCRFDTLLGYKASPAHAGRTLADVAQDPRRSAGLRHGRFRSAAEARRYPCGGGSSFRNAIRRGPKLSCRRSFRGSALRSPRKAEDVVEERRDAPCRCVSTGREHSMRGRGDHRRLRPSVHRKKGEELGGLCGSFVIRATEAPSGTYSPVERKRMNTEPHDCGARARCRRPRSCSSGPAGALASPDAGKAATSVRPPATDGGGPSACRGPGRQGQRNRDHRTSSSCPTAPEAAAVTVGGSESFRTRKKGRGRHS